MHNIFRLHAFAFIAALALTGTSFAAASVVKVAVTPQGCHLLRDGKPYFIKGAGGDASKEVLKQVGGNSFRTWGADALEPQLQEAQKLGLTVTVGIWLGHKDQGFDYHNPAQVAAQYDMARQVVLRYRNSPALLLWGLGNEMEAGQEDDPAVWTAIEKIAALVKSLDPNHPTMTVIAELGGDKIAQINKYCPDIDIVGINSYAGAASVPTRYKAAGGVKPYVITEYGPPGTWEIGKTSWGAAAEPTSTEKANWYRSAYEKGIVHQPLCLGSYAFTWGHKQEATATWFGLFLPDGSRLAAVDTLTELWSGKPATQPCPVIRSLTVAGPDKIQPGAKITASLEVSGAEHEALSVDWVVQPDAAVYHTGGASEASPAMLSQAIIQHNTKSAEVQLSVPGGYRLYAYVHDQHGGAAVANIPLLVQSDHD